MNQNRKREITTLVVVFLGVLLVSALAVYFIGGRNTRPDYTQVQQPGQVEREPGLRPTPTPAENESFLDRLMGTRSSDTYVRGERWIQTMGRIALRLLLATLLGAALAYRPRRRILALKRNPYVSQTQILLAIVAAALMIIVGDNAARAFGIFAAVSLVRFRTNIRDPKEITVLLISLALGLASGVGRWDLALVLAVFSFLVLWILEWREPEQVFRSMDLKVRTRNVVSTQRALRDVFRKHGFDKELRAIDREASQESPGTIVYSVDVSPTVSTDELSADILDLDGKNVEGLEWDQKKSYSYLYQ
ncbi:MAG TPA: DUF4956 domain-containing protein [Pyrinomonadaceae bacterium]|jgi:uncharacterized membrane protein YhiD involved in acid resistance|nr:DUF4956 domain-containing protein [Pyrinomonadaceae bacterium]